MTMTLENIEGNNSKSCNCKKNLRKKITLDEWNKLSKEAMGREARKLLLCLHFGIVCPLLSKSWLLLSMYIPFVDGE